MIKATSKILSSVLLLSGLFCYSTEAQEMEQVTKVGVYENPPLLYTGDDGKAQGLFAELLNHIAEQEKLEIKYISGTWEEVLNRLEAGKIDILPAVAYSQDRSHIYYFNQETVFSNWGQIYTNLYSDVNSFLDLEGLTIAVVTDDIHYSGENGLKNTLDQFSIQCTYLEVDSYTHVMSTIERGQADAGVLNRLNGRLLARQYSVSTTPILFNPIEMRFAGTQNNESRKILQIIDEHIRRMQGNPDSFYERLLEKYVRSAIPEHRLPQWIRYGGPVLLFALIIALLIIALFKSQLQHKTEDLRLSRENLRTTLNSIGEGVITTDTQQNITSMNPIAVQLTGWAQEAAHGKKISEVVDIDNQNEELTLTYILERAIKEKEVVKLSEHTSLTSKTGKSCFINISCAPIESEKGELLGSVLVIHDTTETYMKDLHLEKSRHRYKNLFSSIRDTIIIADRDRVIKDANQPALKDMFGYEIQEIINQQTSILYADQNGYETTGDEVFDKDNKSVGKILRIFFKRKDGSVFPAELFALKLIDEENRVVGNLGIIRDISARHKAEEALTTQLLEKETLVKEIHHRVKNNLNVVVSLLNLQKENIKTISDAYEAFDESSRRIFSMALVHESLYQSESMSRVNMYHYIKRMVDELQSSMNYHKKIDYVINVDQIDLDITKAIPCGIIINELVTNAIKHAFAGRNSGQIEIALQGTNESFIDLSVYDDGVELPYDFSISNSNSLGLNLIRVLTDQISGTFQIKVSNGKRFSITFPGQ